MRSWPAPAAPSSITGQLGPAPALRVFDSVERCLVTTAPGRTARMYVCGITPYDATHLGHAATYVAFDLMLRAWQDAGQDVTYVQNVTDVDDPLLERARDTGEDWRVLGERQTELFRDDMAALRVLPPQHFVGAVEAMPAVDRLIQRLVERGAVYDIDGDWYFAVSADETFGAVSGLSRATMLDLFGERGGDPARAGKKDPLDCLVWRRERAGEPAWDSQLGNGRPGWHVECTAIAVEHLGMSFDVQGGGSDLAFPHHEMCAAQGQVADGGQPFAQAYVHAGMVGLDGAKMSKSRGNLVFVSTLRAEGVDPMAIRLAILDHHYRGDWDWTTDGLRRAQQRLGRWRAAVAAAQAPAAEPVVAAVRAALAADLDAPRALRIVDEWADATLAGAGHDAEASGAVKALCDARLGVAL